MLRCWRRRGEGNAVIFSMLSVAFASAAKFESQFAVVKLQWRQQRQVGRTTGFQTKQEPSNWPAMTVSSNWPLFAGCAAVASLAATLCAMVTDTDWSLRAWKATTSRLGIFCVSDSQMKRSHDMTSARPASLSNKQRCFRRSLFKINNASWRNLVRLERTLSVHVDSGS